MRRLARGRKGDFLEATYFLWAIMSVRTLITVRVRVSLTPPLASPPPLLHSGLHCGRDTLQSLAMTGKSGIIYYNSRVVFYEYSVLFSVVYIVHFDNRKSA